MHRSKLLFSFVAMLAWALPASQSSAQALTTLTSFNGTNGISPTGNLTLVGSTLYGMTSEGGLVNGGTIFSLPVSGGAPTTLSSFNGTGDGDFPQGSLTLSADGTTFYGMTTEGGPINAGVVFGFPVSGGTPTVLFPFDNTHGQNPEYTNLTLSPNGSTLYGMTEQGGARGNGEVFSMPVSGGTPTVLLSFNGDANPYGSLTLSADGSTLYGMSMTGIFSEPVTGGFSTTLATFGTIIAPSDPYGSLTLIGSTLYGMTSQGGLNDDGAVFSIPVTGGPLTLLASFNQTDGSGPRGDLTLVGSTLYGMTMGGGENNKGTIFSLPLAGGTPTTLISFNGTNGSAPVGSLTASGSILYGMTSRGGTNGDGTAFALNLAATPEPSSLVLAALGAACLFLAARRRKA